MDAVTVFALSCAVIGVFLLGYGLIGLIRGRMARSLASLTSGALLLAAGFLIAGISLGTQGYRSLTRETVAAEVMTEPIAEKRFRARFRFADGREQVFDLSGDELYVDAHILKWTPLANFFGMHTAYELDRVSGRYRDLGAEQINARTVFSLAEAKPVDMFELRRRYAFLSFLLDAEYGSATFVPADKPAEYELRVSTSGLLIRRRDSQ